MEAQALAREMGLDDTNIDRRKIEVGLEPSDIARIAAIKDVVLSHIDECTRTFFDHLSRLDDARPLFDDKAALERAVELKREHLIAMVGGEYGLRYAQQRIELASIYAAAGLGTGSFLGAFHHLLKSVGVRVMKQSQRAPLEGFESFMSLKKVAFIDIGLITDVLVFERERIIRRQQEAIKELSTPVLQVRDQLLIIPIIGLVDTHRARLLTEGLLKAIRARRAKGVVMDVTGVPIVDSKVANHLAQACEAARLMGALVVMTGISSEIALTMVTIGARLRGVHTVGDLQGGIEVVERFLERGASPDVPTAHADDDDVQGGD
jgi:rsbT co-antagonist protein RsbR